MALVACELQAATGSCFTATGERPAIDPTTSFARTDTLYELTRLDDVTFRRASQRGDISPEMERGDALGLLNKARRLQDQRRATEQNVGDGYSLISCDPRGDPRASSRRTRP